MGKIITKKDRGMNWMSKSSLVLVLALTVILALSIYPASAYIGTGQMVYNINTTTPQARTYTVSSNTFAAGIATVAGGTPSWVKVVAGTVRNESVVAYVDTANTLRILYWNGTAWSAAAPHNWTAALGASGASGRGFDIAVEKLSGDIVVAYTTNAAGTEINFRRWDGATWTAAVGYDSARLTGTVRFIKMESKPNADDIGLIMADTNNDLSAAIWNGTTNAFGNPPAAVLSASAAFLTAGAVDSQSFDLAYEGLTGDLLVAWANDGIATGLFYNTFSGGAWGTTAQNTNMTEAFEHVDCAGDILSDNIICAAVGNLTQDMRVNVWNGTAWQGNTTDVDTSSAPATFVAGRRYLSVGWLTSGATKLGIIGYNNNNGNNISYATVNTDGTFTGNLTNTTATPTPVGGVAYSDVIMDPYNNDRLLYIFQDTTNFDIFAKRLIMDGAGTLTWSDANAGAVINAAPTTSVSQAFHFAYDALDNTAPATSGLAFDSAVYTTFVGSPFSFHGDLTDNGSAVASCQVCVKNGSECVNADTWIAGTLSGSSPVWTCTATNVTTYSNGGAITSGDNVYIDVRGTSTGGQNVDGGTAIFKTMDKTGPVDGATFTITPGADQNALSWAAAVSDAQSGIRATDTYVVRALAGTTPPSTCSTGTAIYTGTGLSYTHTNLTPYAGGYSYRVCAYDNVGSPSTGLTGTGLPTWSSTLNSCARCHAYPPTDGTRDASTGAVVGDHQPHNLVCTTCHVAPATQTSADYGHRNGVIQMSATISGGVYSKGASFTQSNNPTTGTCGTNTCHGGGSSPQWGVGTADCVICHNAAIGTRSNVVAEFGLAYGHKKSGRGAVTAADCIVCHLEGNYTTQKTTAYHMDGNIDLRDPDGAGETPITNIASGTWTFTKFATSYAAGSRTSTGHTAETVDNILTQKFCLPCHDSNGATNTTARTSGGTQYMPWGGVNLGANYTVLNGAATAGGVIDAKTQFATTNSSAHPVRGPRNKDFATPARFNAPYNNFTRAGTSGTKTNGVVINCFDCHNTSGLLTTRTTAAHGNAVTVRGTFYVNSPTLCTACHAGYTAAPGATNQHGAGSAMATAIDGGEAMTTACTNCHSSQSALPARPRPAADYHGFNALTNGGLWPTVNSRPFAFIRSWTGTAYHRPFRSTEFTTGSATCGAGTCPGGGQVGNGTTELYTPGGSY